MESPCRNTQIRPTLSLSREELFDLAVDAVHSANANTPCKFPEPIRKLRWPRTVINHRFDNFPPPIEILPSNAADNHMETEMVYDIAA